MYNYNEIIRTVNQGMLDTVIDTIRANKGTIMTYYDFGRNLHGYDSWKLLACIDYCASHGLIRLVENSEFTQNKKYKPCI